MKLSTLGALCALALSLALAACGGGLSGTPQQPSVTPAVSCVVADLECQWAAATAAYTAANRAVIAASQAGRISLQTVQAARRISDVVGDALAEMRAILDDHAAGDAAAALKRANDGIATLHSIAGA